MTRPSPNFFKGRLALWAVIIALVQFQLSCTVQENVENSVPTVTTALVIVGSRFTCTFQEGSSSAIAITILV